MKESTTFVGMDVHKKQHTVAMLLPEDETDSPNIWTVNNRKAKIRTMVRRVIKKAPGGVVFCYEAGTFGFALQRQIQAEGAGCIVIAPSLTPSKPGQKIKTDRRDARDLVAYLRSGMLTEVYPPDEEAESARDLVRSREGAVKDLTRARHQISKFLLRRGIIYCDGEQWTQKHYKWLCSVQFDFARDTAIYNDYICEMLHRKDRLAVLTKAVEELAKEDRYAEAVGWLCCFRGIDVITAITLMTELFAFGRFQSPRKLMSYLGLVPSERSSGETEKKGSITKMGNRRVRSILVQAGWNQLKPVRVSKALKKRRAGQPDWVIKLADRAMLRLHKRYWYLVSSGKMPTKAVVAVAREMVGFIWATLHYGEQAPVHFKEPIARNNRAEDEKRQTVVELLETA